MLDLIKKIRSENTALRKEVAKLKRLSYYDELTGLLNKAGFEHRILASLSMVKRERSKLCLGSFDLDGFKQNNDKLGHKEGDKILIIFAKVLNNYMRLGDLLCRWGGDEFVVALPLSRLSDAINIGERIRKHVERKYKHNKYPITVSGAFNEISFEKSNAKIAISDLTRIYEHLFNQADKKLLSIAKLNRNRIV